MKVNDKQINGQLTFSLETVNGMHETFAPRQEVVF